MDRLGVLLSVAEAASQEHSPADLVRSSSLPSRWPSCYLCAWFQTACICAGTLPERHAPPATLPQEEL